MEKTGLLHRVGLPGSRRRPADVLICANASFLTGLPGGDPPSNGRKVALDFAVINAMGQGHLDQTRRGPLTAAIEYSKQKAAYLNTRSQCEQEGIVFEPIVLELQGGIEPRAAAILHRIAECVAAVESTPLAKLKASMFQRIAVIVARSSALAIRRRLPSRTSAPQPCTERMIATARTLDQAP